MPPDDTGEFDDADLPGLDDDTPSTEADGWDDADLPGLDDDSPSPEAEVPAGDPFEQFDKGIEEWGQHLDEMAAAKASSEEWTDAELDDWFENVFGGDAMFKERFGRDGEAFDRDSFKGRFEKHHVSYSGQGSDFYGAVHTYVRLHEDLAQGITEDEGGIDGAVTDDWGYWNRLRTETKIRFRRGWEDYLDRVEKAKPKPPRWVWVGGAGLLGLVLTVGFFISSGDTDDTAVAVPSETPVVEAAPPSTEAIVVDTEAPAVAVGVPDESAVPFPTTWTYTATKTASIVPAPDFITATPVGAVLPWAFNVTETCQQEVCTYVTAINPLIPDPLFPAPPETTWVVVGTEWSLDVTYVSGSSSYGDGTICALRNRDTFELTVTEEIINGQSVPTAFTGTWVQALSDDPGASSGNVDFYCSEPFEVVDEWSLVGVTG